MRTVTHLVRKRCGSRFLAGHALFWGSIVNDAADGKRLRAIDAFRRSGI